jgi:hypothetical protein
MISSVALAGLCLVFLLTLFAAAMSISLRAACRDQKLPNRPIEFWTEEWDEIGVRRGRE